MAEKTIVIWDTLGEKPVAFYICEGDLSELNNVYINSTDNTEGQEAALNQAIDNGRKVASFPMEFFSEGADLVVVIVAGFLP